MANHNSTIKAVCDLTRKDWKIISNLGNHSLLGNELELAGAWLQIAFRDNDKLPVNFDNLQYGYTISYKGDVIQTMKWPVTEDLKYISTDQDFDQIIRCEIFTPGKKHELYCWAKNGNDMIEITYTINAPGYTI